MRIIIYVMSFFIISAEKAYDEKELFRPETYVHHAKYANLQASCDAGVRRKGNTGYIKETYYNIKACWLSGIFGKSKLEKLKNHKYYENDLIRLKVYQKYSGDNENELLSTLLPLLDAIPDKIIIKKGIIYTVKNSIVSGIDITETISATPRPNFSQTYTDISTRLPCDPMDPNTKYGDVEYVVMDVTNIYAYYRCGGRLEKQKFQLSDEESEEKIIKKIDMQCTLRLNIADKRNNFGRRLTPVLSKTQEKLMKKSYISHVRFQLKFSYICKFVSPLQVFLNKNILQYKILNFTVSGYQFKDFILSMRKCIGLTYCLRHQNIITPDGDFEKYFLYQSFINQK
ncbi:uncharacterized protein LOC142333452 isoform X31 [Lycorma delicatula]|uniref:uncharacterized protein LOC142333452 isoform X31 n=1 Tax=Lycorma delicatula TaxID=130591 RepID=UPI003F51798F